MQPPLADSDGAPEGAPSTSAPAPGAQKDPVLYIGPFSKPHKRLKWASLVNTFVSLGACPFIVAYSDASPLVRVGLAMSVAGFGVFTTAALHWFASPYVHELHVDQGNGLVTATTINVLGLPRVRRFQLDDVTFPRGFHPLTTFVAKGKKYYIEKALFPDGELLRRLSPVDPELVELQRMTDAYKQE